METDFSLELGNGDRPILVWNLEIETDSGLKLGNRDRKKFNYQPIRIAELRVANRNSAQKSAILRILKIICEPIFSWSVKLKEKYPYLNIVLLTAWPKTARSAKA
ncbi:hypothetical protein RhiirA1_388753 [Rhizophagus irregularis]|uniref:Uncharacterized protein n=1 Tax=Rhizophagus irregularis TaxID=588596 RepID=A0A2N0SDP8_9GLOM|nr:hypothetical protein RhiirA1_388753 [Rhizophagus irregularis]